MKEYNINDSFNTIPLSKWDGIALWHKYPSGSLEEIRMKTEDVSFPTLANLVCIYKAKCREFVIKNQ